MQEVNRLLHQWDRAISRLGALLAEQQQERHRCRPKRSEWLQVGEGFVDETELRSLRSLPCLRPATGLMGLRSMIDITPT